MPISLADRARAMSQRSVLAYLIQRQPTAEAAASGIETCTADRR